MPTPSFDLFWNLAKQSGYTFEQAQAAYQDEFGRTPVFQNAPPRDAFRTVATEAGLTEDEADSEYDKLFRFGLGEEVYRAVKRSGGNLIQNISAFGRALTGGVDPGAIEKYGHDVAVENFSSPGATPFTDEDGTFNWEVFKEPQTLIAGIAEQAPVLGGQVGLGTAAARLAGALPLPPPLKAAAQGAAALGAFGVAGAAPEAGGQALEAESRGMTPEQVRDIALQNFAGVAGLNLLPGAALFSKARALPKALGAGAFEAGTESAEEVLGQYTMDPAAGLAAAYQQALPGIHQVAPIAFLTGGLMGGMMDNQDLNPPLPETTPPPAATGGGGVQAQMPEAGGEEVTAGIPPLQGAMEPVIGPEPVQTPVSRPLETATPLTIEDVTSAIQDVQPVSGPLSARLRGDTLAAEVLSKARTEPLTPAQTQLIERAAQLAESPSPVVETTMGQRFGIVPRNDGWSLIEETPVGQRLVQHFNDPVQAYGTLAAIEQKVPREAPVSPETQQQVQSAIQQMDEVAMKPRQPVQELMDRMTQLVQDQKDGKITPDEFLQLADAVTAEAMTQFANMTRAINAPAVPFTLPENDMEALNNAPALPMQVLQRQPPKKLANEVAPMNDEQHLYMQVVFRDLVNMGMPPELFHGVTLSFHPDAMGRPMASFRPMSRLLSIREDVLDGAMRFRKDPGAQEAIRLFVAHELWHGADFDHMAKSGVVPSEEFRVDFPVERPTGPALQVFGTTMEGGQEVPGWALGNVISEMYEAYKNDTAGLADMLKYPFAKLKVAYNDSDQQGVDWVKFEAFAQLGGLFTIHPELVKQHMPAGYALMEKITNDVEQANGAFGLNSAVRENLSAASPRGSAQRIARERVIETARQRAAERGAGPRAPPVRDGGRGPVEERAQLGPEDEAVLQKAVEQYESMPPGREREEAMAETGAARDAYNELYDLGYRNPLMPQMLFLNKAAWVEAKPLGDYLHLSAIASIEQGQGYASDALRKVLAVADKHGVPVELDVQPFGLDRGMTKTQLAAWYKRYGFKPIGTSRYMLRRDPAPMEEVAIAEDVGGIQMRETTQAGGFRRNARGDFSGAPPGINSEQAMEDLVEKISSHLDNALAQGPESFYWYERSAEAIMEVAQRNRDKAEKLIRLMALYSQANSVGGNTTAAIKSLNEYLKGNKAPLAGRFPNQTGPVIDGILQAKTMSRELPGVEDKIMSFYRNLHDSAFGTNFFERESTTDRWMMRNFGYETDNPSRAQYAFAKDLIQQVTDDYNARHGTNLLPRNVQAGLWVYERNKSEKAKAKAAGKTFTLPPRHDFSNEISRATQNVTLEVIPSTTFGLGLENLPAAQKRKFTNRAFGLIATNKKDQLAEALGVPLYLGRKGTGLFEGQINPNVIAGLVTTKIPDLLKKPGKEGKYPLKFDRTAVDLYSWATQYIYRQDGVPWFRPDPKMTGKLVSHGRAFRFKTPLNSRSLNQFKAALTELVGPGAGFTQTNGNEIVVINFRDENGKPYLMPDSKFSSLMEDLSERLPDLKDFGSFKSEGDYHVHDWKADPKGKALEGKISAAGRSDLLPWLRDRRAAYERLVEETLGVEDVELGIDQGVDLTQEFQGPNQPLPENPERYFNMPPGTLLVPLRLIKPIRAKPKGVQNANKFMREAFDGRSEKRKPVTLSSDGTGVFVLEDGNSTYANAVANNWLFIPAQIEGSGTSKPLKKSEGAMDDLTQAPSFQTSNMPRPVGSSRVPPSKDMRTTSPPSTSFGPATTTLSGIVPPRDISELNVTKPIIFHDNNDVNVILGKINKILPRVKRDLFHAARSIGRKVGGPRVKAMDGIERKIAGGRQPERIGDILGARILLQTPEDFEPALEALRAVPGYEIMEVDDFRLKPKGGYRAVHVQMKHKGEGVSFEVQLIPEVTANEQDSGRTHVLYEKWRVLDQLYRDNADSLSIEEFREMRILEGEMYTLHSALWQRFNNLHGAGGDIVLGYGETPTMEGASLDEPLPKYAASINLTKLASPEDVKRLINEMSIEKKDEITAQRRGVQDWGKTERLAETLGMSLKEYIKKAPGTAFNAEQLEFSRSLMELSARNLRDKARQAALTQSNEDQVAFKEAYDLHAMIQSVHSGVATEAGRALNILRKQSRDVKNLNDLIDSIGGKTALDDLARLVAESETAGELTRAVRDTYKPKISDILLEVWINSLLSGPQTHAVNMLSNTLIGQLTSVEHYLAAFIGKLHGGDKVTFREANAYAIGGIQGAREGLRLARIAFATEEPSDPNTKLEARKYRAISSDNLPGGKVTDRVGRFIRIPGRALQAEDEFFKSMGRRRMLNALAARQAMKEGLSGQALTDRIRELVTSPPAWMDKMAKERAAYLTFTNKLGSFGQAVQKLASAHPVLRIVMPFIRTPTNIVKFAAARSPFGLLMKEVRDQIFGDSKIDRDVALARMILGSSIGAYIAMLTMEGLITGGGPDDPKRRNLMYASGWQPYSIKVGNEWIAYSRLEPMGMLFGVAADMAELSRWMDEDDQANVAALITGSITKNLTSKTWLRGVSEALNALHDPDRYGANYIRNLVSTVIPTGVAQIARINDPLLRDSRSILDRIKTRIPGRGGDVTPKVDVWGNPISLEGGIGPDLLSPIYVSRMKGDIATQTLLDMKYFPGAPKREIGGVELNQRQYFDYSETAGKLAYKLMSRIAANPRFQAMNNYQQKDITQKVFNHARKLARQYTILRYPDLRRQIEGEILEKKRMKAGL